MPSSTSFHEESSPWIWSTVEKWYIQALHFKLTWERADSIARQRGNTSIPFQSNQTRNPTFHQKVAQKKDPNTMDVDAVQTGKLAPEEKEHCINNNPCFCCRKHRHSAIKCQIYPNNNNNNYQWNTSAIAKIEEIPDEDSPMATVSWIST